MIKSQFLYIILLVLFFCPAVYADDDMALWTEASVDLYTKDYYQLNFTNSFRTGDHLDRPYFNLSSLNNRFKLSESFSVGINYSFVRAQDFESNWLSENRPSVSFKYKNSYQALKYSLKSKAEYRVISFEPQKDFFRFRNRIKFAYPLDLLGYNEDFFISNELYYSNLTSRWSQNRFFTGFEFNHLKSLNFAIAYGIRSIRENSNWQDQHLLLLKFAF